MENCEKRFRAVKFRFDTDTGNLAGEKTEAVCTMLWRWSHPSCYQRSPNI